MKPARMLAWARRVLLFAVIGLLLYGWRRFDVVTLPEGAHSPLFGIHPGDRLLVDRRAEPGAGEENWLYRDGAGALLLGRTKGAHEGVAALEAGQVWLEFEREVPGLADSRTNGPVPRSALAGRVVFVLPRTTP
ncbi:MAG: hypothetical protein ABL998_07995 [Planctomycetota bacterium]